MTALFLLSMFLKALDSTYMKFYEKHKRGIILCGIIVMTFDLICLFNYFKILWHGTY